MVCIKSVDSTSSPQSFSPQSSSTQLTTCANAVLCENTHIDSNVRANGVDCHSSGSGHNYNIVSQAAQRNCRTSSRPDLAQTEHYLWW